MIEDLLFIPHDDSFEEKCMGSWDEEDVLVLVYTSNVIHRRKKMRDFFKRNKPSDSLIRDLIIDKQYTAVEIIASFYEFKEEQQRNVVNGDARMRKAYSKHHQFRRDIEPKFIRTATTKEAQSYYSKYYRKMNPIAVKDCRITRKVNMKCFALTLSAYDKKREAKKREEEQAPAY